MPIKLSNRIPQKSMVTPGVRDNGLMPNSGSSASGITLDYSAISSGGIDTGEAYNRADDAAVLKAKKAPDFETTGTYLVETSGGQKKIYRDPENREWYEDSNKHYSQSWLGSTKKEALDRLAKLYSDEIMANEADDEDEGIKYSAYDLTSNWWSGDYLIKLAGNLWESAAALTWPWINKVQLARHKQKADGSWEEVYKVVDANDVLILLPTAVNEANDLYSGNFSSEHYNNAYGNDVLGRGSMVGSKDDGFELRQTLTAGIVNLPQYEDPNMYEQNSNPRNETEPELTTYEDMGRNMAEERMAEGAEDKDGDEIEATEEAMYADDREVGFVFRCNLDYGATKKKAYPDWSNVGPQYRQITDEQDYNTTPEFDLFAINFADDNKWNKEDLGNPFLYPLSKRRWKENIGDNIIWNTMMNEYPYLMDERATEQDINEWIEALKWRMGIPPKYNAQIKGVIDELRSLPKSMLDNDDNNDLYGKLVLLLRQHTYQDPDWVKANAGNRDSSVFSDLAGNDDELETSEDETEVMDDEEKQVKQAFLKTAVTYDANPVIQALIKIPSVKALLDQQLSGFADKVIVTTTSADVAQTQQQSGVKLEPISGNPFGHVFVSEDPITHQKKPLDRIIRIDRVTDPLNALNTILHESLHLRHPTHSEGQVESEAKRLADTVKQFITNKAASKKVLFVKNSLKDFPVVECSLADTYQKQVIGLQNHRALDHKTGMIFQYKRPQALSFWMGTVPFPIDIIFLNADNKILKIARNCLPNSQEIYSCDNASKVIEVIGSFCAFHDLDVGDQVFEADDEPAKKEDYTQHILQKIQAAKLIQQADLDMMDWNVKIVMRKEPDSRRFLKVSWTPEDYMMKKADILVNPDPKLISEALKKMPLNKLLRHALLHILAGHKNELSTEQEDRLITQRLYEGNEDRPIY